MPDLLKTRLTVYRRTTTPPPMKLTARDYRILEAIHAFDGILADYQIQRLFFTGRTQMQLRTRLLYQHGYLARPDRQRRAALPAMVYWLDKRGAEYVASLHGQTREEFAYRAEPRWSLVPHDLMVNDVRISVLRACARSPNLELAEWIPSGEFWAYPDTVEYIKPTGTKDRRKVRPDGYFIILVNGQPRRFLLELDRATEDNPRFAREKVLPGIAYLRSDTYARRFGHSSGRWLVVTTGERRMRNMREQTRQAAGRDANLFYFTTFQAVAADTALTAPIWHPGGDSEPTALFRL
jgi:hypothetical protein